MRRILVAAACILVIAAGTGCHKKKKKKGGGAEVEATPVAAKHEVKQQVEIEVDGSGFHPDQVWANRGEPITLVFKRDTEKTCATDVVIAEEGIRKPLPVDQEVKVVLLPGKTGKLHFACPMNMFGGDINVQ